MSRVASLPVAAPSLTPRHPSAPTVEIRGQLEVQLRVFVAVFNSFSKTCTSVILGLDAEISVT